MVGGETHWLQTPHTSNLKTLGVEVADPADTADTIAQSLPGAADTGQRATPPSDRSFFIRHAGMHGDVDAHKNRQTGT